MIPQLFSTGGRTGAREIDNLTNRKQKVLMPTVAHWKFNIRVLLKIFFWVLKRDECLSMSGLEYSIDTVTSGSFMK